MTVAPNTPIDPAPLRGTIAHPALFAGGPAAPPRTLMDVFDETARRHPDGLAVDDGVERLTYRTLRAQVHALGRQLAAIGVGRGDRVGVRAPSGTADLYVSILGVLAAGAAYVPVDADDPPDRAALVFTEARVKAVIGAERTIEPRPSGAVVADAGAADADACVPAHAPGTHGDGGRPRPEDDAWIIFTSGSTGRPKGVAVSHRCAAALVDAEAGLFLRRAPLGPGDRVLAGLSVAFDASCEEMWLAWRHGACLVPAPRSLVRAGADLGPWLARQRITVVSTVPTLAALWPVEALDEVRLLIFGGEACPPELVRRMAVPGREVWNTYGPTETTVIACAARLTGEGPVRIGLPLDGWTLAVVDPSGAPVPMGGSGELVIGGVGLARYLDPVKTAEKYAPLAALGWPRAYRSGDLVRADELGLIFLGRADDQVKLGGRRIELGEIDAALRALPGVSAAAAALRTTESGHPVLVGYLVPKTSPTAPTAPTAATAATAGTVPFDRTAALDHLRSVLPAPLVPLLAVVDDLPVRTSGKVDRDALPWPLTTTNRPTAGPRPAAVTPVPLTPAEAWLAAQWSELLGTPVTDPEADFFAHGGGSLAAAQLVSRIRERYGTGSVADVYRRPRLHDLALTLGPADAVGPEHRRVRAVPRRAQAVQLALLLPLYTVAALRWSVIAAAVGRLLGFGPAVSWWWIGLGWLAFLSPPGRIAIAAGGARLLLRGLRPGTHARGGPAHLRLWTADRLAEMSGAVHLTGPWLIVYARALGARIATDVDLHALPPVTGWLRLGRGCAVEPEADLSGYWIDGDRVRIGPVRVGADAVVGARATLFPGARIGKRARVAPGAVVTGAVPAGERWSGAPATRAGRARRTGGRRPVRRRRWSAAYALASLLLSLLPAVAVVPGLLVVSALMNSTDGTDGMSSTDGMLGLGDVSGAFAALPLATVTVVLAYAFLTWVGVRVLSLGLCAGSHPLHGRVACQTWVTERLMDMARTHLQPLYASLLTPVWLRALGMRMGHGVEASTVLAVPAMTSVGDGAFLADDTMVGPYELGGGRLRIAAVRIGKRAFLGNSGMTAAGRRVPKRGLVGVLSAAPKRAKAGSSWLGLPPMKLTRPPTAADEARTFAPPRRLRWARAAVELCRIVPLMCGAALALAWIVAFCALAARLGPPLAVLLGGLLLLICGAIAALLTIAAKWLLVGRFTPGGHPLWSAFVWRDELADCFVESLAVPWLVGSLSGTPLMPLWLRCLGARLGRGVWCETYWLPEPDLVRVGEGASINRGCVVQTHLFHDRIMRLDTIALEAGTTLGPHVIVLPGAMIGRRAVIGPGSLVMSGERVPAHSTWLGNPIAVWKREAPATAAPASRPGELPAPTPGGGP
ncbi:Pls/PosA family non-ribosomal peptide synthetase [Streptomyces sp. NPDC056500]|uniref:Pls/PosA family non-ribosomal peptide synthetase n=1 Tax=Streptomyces sp. NPDC056500 TaxID=3345840 RepID=UPI003691A3D2